MPFDFDHNQFIKILGLLGSLAGAIALIWRLIDVIKAFLHVEVTVDKIDGSIVKIRTVVRNANTIARKLDAAFLVIGPANENPEKTVAALFEHVKEPRHFKTLNEMVHVVSDRVKNNRTPIHDGGGRVLIPLPYYYIENYDVADETLSYEQIINCELLPVGPYGVRFYIEARLRLHRVVHAAFEVHPPAQAPVD
jgi:hypothetical protein